jgi:uncharacterized protein (DUF433 family)
MTFTNTLDIGNGIYTLREISQILRLDYQKVHRWLNKYWDGELGAKFQRSYSWSVDTSKAVAFHTLIEFYVMMQLAEAGVKTRQVLIAHEELSKWSKTPSPFAQREVLQRMRTDGKKVYFEIGEHSVSLDGTGQLNLDFIRIFFKNLDFGNDLMAERFWPLGRDKAILVDPKRKFGHPVIDETNIYPETIYNLYKGGESEDYIAFLYEITPRQVEDAIEYCQDEPRSAA